jgi:hypothetical protein
LNKKFRKQVHEDIIFLKIARYYFLDMTTYFRLSPSPLECATETVRHCWSHHEDVVRRAVQTIVESGDDQDKQQAFSVFERALPEWLGELHALPDWDHFDQLEDGRGDLHRERVASTIRFCEEMLNLLGQIT